MSPLANMYDVCSPVRVPSTPRASGCTIYNLFLIQISVEGSFVLLGLALLGCVLTWARFLRWPGYPSHGVGARPSGPLQRLDGARCPARSQSPPARLHGARRPARFPSPADLVIPGFPVPLAAAAAPRR